MDRAELSGAIIQEAGAVFMEALAAAAPALVAADLDGIERRLQAVGRQVLGRVVEQVIAARAAAPGAAPPACGRCGGAMRCAGRARPRRLQGLVGDYTLRRPYYVCPACRRGHAPLDAHLGLDGGALSPGLSRVACRLGIEGAFGAAADQLAEALGVAVPEEAVRRITEGVGAVAEAERQALMAQARRGQPVAPTPRAGAEGPAAVLVVEVDGVQAPLLDGWHELKVSRVAPLGPALRADPETGRTHLALGPSGYGAGLEPAEACWWRAYVEACRQGLGTSVRTVVALGDGAEWIWAHAGRFLGGAGAEVVEIVDIYHAYEHLWTVANAVFGPGSPAAAGWVEPLKDRLYREGAAPVLAALAGLTPPEAAAAEEVRLALGYFAGHAARLDYPRFVARQFPIGSGAVESACKALVGQRAKQAGMRWSRAGLQAVASLRALHRSGGWAAFWQAQPQRRRPPVAPRPSGAAPAATPVAAAPPSVVTAAADPRLAPMPADRHAAPPPPPPPTPPTPPPRPLHRPAPPRPAAAHPWRRPLRPRARSA
jgi:hypothetical protein